MQLILVMECDSIAKTDYMYIKAFLDHFYPNRTVKLSPIYLGGKAKYDKVEKKIEEQEYCKVYAQRSDNCSFSYFVKDSYPDWKANNFKIEPTLEDNEITSIKISYDAKEMYPEFGNSGKVDFNFTDYDLHVEFIITNIGSTEVEIPLDLPR